MIKFYYILNTNFSPNSVKWGFPKKNKLGAPTKRPARELEDSSGSRRRLQKQLLQWLSQRSQPQQNPLPMKMGRRSRNSLRMLSPLAQVSPVEELLFDLEAGVLQPAAELVDPTVNPAEVDMIQMRTSFQIVHLLGNN